MDTEEAARNIAWFIRHTIAEAADDYPADPDKWVKVRVNALAEHLEDDSGFMLEHIEWLRRRHESEQVPA